MNLNLEELKAYYSLVLMDLQDFQCYRYCLSTNSNPTMYNSTQFVLYKDIIVLMADLKLVYKMESCTAKLKIIRQKWSKKYPKIAISWENSWSRLSTYFKYSQEVRTLIYITNTIEGYNKITKNKLVFFIDNRLLKILYTA
ncbi:MAG: transposase [Cetobacterium sp.]|uniref:transposase n=1 Tax=Cetobacterium sp. TaxID=2071632 RepID=UPI002FC7110B